MAPYADYIARASATPRPQLWLDLDEIDSQTTARIAELPWLQNPPSAARRWRLKSSGYHRAERRWIPRFDRVFLSSSHEVKKLGATLPPQTKIDYLPNPTPSADPPPPTTGSPPRFLFIGALGYEPNIDAVHWLLHDIWPAIQRETGGELLIAGYHPPAWLPATCENTAGVQFLGTVSKSRTAFAQCDALLVPLRAGGGTRLKILESFALGRPVITTGIGIEGIAATTELHYLSAETPTQFAQQAARLISEPDLALKLASAALDLVRSQPPPQIEWSPSSQN